MKTKHLLLIFWIGSLFLFAGNLKAQIGTSDNYSYSSSSDIREQNARRLSVLEQQVNDARSELKEIRRSEKDAKSALKQARSALKAEKKAQKSRKQANDQARKANKALD